MRLTVLSVCIIFCAENFLFASNVPGQVPKAQERVVAAKDKDAKSQPPVVPAKKESSDSKKDQPTKETPLNWGSIADISTAAFTGVLMVIAFVQLLYFITQLSVMRRTIEHSLDAKAAALLPSITGADLAQPLGNLPGVVRPVVYWLIQNYGETPARLLRFQDRLKWMQALPPVPDFDGEKFEDRARIDTVLAIGQAPFTFACHMEQIQQAQWENYGNMRMHLVARIEYEDLFGRRFIQGFAYRITRIPGAQHITSESAGGPAYNYRRQQQPAGVGGAL